MNFKRFQNYGTDKYPIISAFISNKIYVIGGGNKRIREIIENQNMKHQINNDIDINL